MHFTLAKCSGGVKIKILNLERGGFWTWQFTNSPRPKAATTPQKQDFAASAEDPKKLARVKGSRRVSGAGFCCHRRRPDETRQDQRQQTRLGSKILLPPPKTRRNRPRPKAATTPQKQVFAASVVDPKKLAKVKGSRHASESRILLLLASEGDFSALIMPG